MEFEQAIAAALKEELGLTHQAIKTVMRWTGASERTVKHWFSGTHGPSGQYLIALASNSDEVLSYFLKAANRPSLSIGPRLISIRAMLLELVKLIDASVDT
ncbi:MAG: XRE family transcriptional regulator [Alphaproteobacteria bacterium]